MLLLLGSNQRPQLHLGLAAEAIDSCYPLIGELGRRTAPAVGGRGIYLNILLACRTPSPGVPATIDARLHRIESTLAPERTNGACPLDIDAFLLRHDDGVLETFPRTAKVVRLLAAIDPERRLGLPAWTGL